MVTASPRPTQSRAGKTFGYPLKAGAKINQGAVAVLEAGLLTSGKTGVGLIVVGVADATIDNSGGSSGERLGEVDLGCFLLDNSSAADLIVAADIGADCFLVDDETVAKTDGGGTRSRAGLIRGVEAAGVWVELDGRK